MWDQARVHARVARQQPAVVFPAPNDAQNVPARERQLVRPLCAVLVNCLRLLLRRRQWQRLVLQRAVRAGLAFVRSAPVQVGDNRVREGVRMCVLQLLCLLQTLTAVAHQQPLSAVVGSDCVEDARMKCWRRAWKRINIDVVDLKRVNLLSYRVLSLQQLARPVRCRHTHPDACAVLEHSRGSSGGRKLCVWYRLPLRLGWLACDLLLLLLLVHASSRFTVATVGSHILNVVVRKRSRSRSLSAARGGRLVREACRTFGAHGVVFMLRT